MVPLLLVLLLLAWPARVCSCVVPLLLVLLLLAWPARVCSCVLSLLHTCWCGCGECCCWRTTRNAFVLSKGSCWTSVATADSTKLLLPSPLLPRRIHDSTWLCRGKDGEPGAEPVEGGFKQHCQHNQAEAADPAEGAEGAEPAEGCAKRHCKYSQAALHADKPYVQVSKGITCNASRRACMACDVRGCRDEVR